jgi:hypothetical protein
MDETVNACQEKPSSLFFRDVKDEEKVLKLSSFVRNFSAQLWGL